MNNTLSILTSEGFQILSPIKVIPFTRSPAKRSMPLRIREIIELEFLKRQKGLYERAVLEQMSGENLPSFRNCSYVHMAENPYLIHYFEAYQRFFFARY